MVKHYAHAEPRISYCLPRWLKAGGVLYGDIDRVKLVLAVDQAYAMSDEFDIVYNFLTENRGYTAN